jgi:hypothetical protein
VLAVELAQSAVHPLEQLVVLAVLVLPRLLAELLPTTQVVVAVLVT